MTDVYTWWEKGHEFECQEVWKVSGSEVRGKRSVPECNLRRRWHVTCAAILSRGRFWERNSASLTRRPARVRYRSQVPYPLVPYTLTFNTHTHDVWTCRSRGVCQRFYCWRSCGCCFQNGCSTNWTCEASTSSATHFQANRWGPTLQGWVTEKIPRFYNGSSIGHLRGVNQWILKFFLGISVVIKSNKVIKFLYNRKGQWMPDGEACDIREFEACQLLNSRNGEILVF